MKFCSRALIIASLLLTLPIIIYAQSGKGLKKPLKLMDNGSLLIEDFERDTVGALPSGWYNRDVLRKANHPEESKLFHYSIQEEDGNQFLFYNHTDARHLNYPLAKREGINIHETPILSWKWRVDKVPEGGNEDSKHMNDVAASIYVVFDMGRVALVKKVPKSIRYTWSSTLPEGKEMSKFFGNQKIVVMQSGEDNLGEWITEKRNIVEDYKRLFGDNPPKRPLAILILSDADETNSTAIAAYDDIMLHPIEMAN